MNPDQISEAIKLARELIDVIPEEARKDLLNPIAKSAGRGSSSFLNIITYPFNSLNISLENRLTEKAARLEAETQQKIKKLQDDGRYTEVNAGMAIKAIEGSRYSLDSDILRSYFSELIANSFDTNNIDKVSPIFSTILSNLTELDALFLKKVKNSFNPKSFAITSIVFYDEKKYRYVHTSDLIIWEVGLLEEVGSTLNVLESFGIVTIDRMSLWTTDPFPEMYKSVEQSPFYKTAEKLIGTEAEYQTIGHNDGCISITQLGQLFIDMVVG